MPARTKNEIWYPYAKAILERINNGMPVQEIAKELEITEEEVNMFWDAYLTVNKGIV